MLRYETDIAMDDSAALRREAADIWTDFRSIADSLGVNAAILSANTPPSGGPIRRSSGYNFVYEKHPDGTWSLSKGR